MTAAARVPVVEYACANGVGRIVLDRPRLNILNTPLLEALAAALEQARLDHDVRVLTLEGRGHVFCAGVDVREHLPPHVEGLLARFHDVVRRILAFEAPVVALVHGTALGGGLELALAADLVLVADEASLGQPEITLGVLPPVAAALLPRLVGRSCALDLVLTGRSVTGVEAVKLGLAARHWPLAQFDGEAAAFVSAVAAHSGPVLKLAKRALRLGAMLPARAALDAAEELYLTELMGLDDAREGLTAWLEKRPAVWRGT